MPPHNSMDSMGPGPPPYGHAMGAGPMGGRYEMSGTSEMTTTHGTGMSGGCVSVTQNMMPGNANTIPPNSMPPSTMPMNTMCDMNNGIPPNAMAPPTSHMGGPQSMGPHGMGPQGMNAMGPGMAADSHPAMMPGMKPVMPSTQQDGSASDVDVKPTLSSTIAGNALAWQRVSECFRRLFVVNQFLFMALLYVSSLLNFRKCPTRSKL